MSLLLLFNQGGGGGPTVTICLWNRIDTYFQAQLEEHLGVGGDYSTLALAGVEVGDTFDVDHVTLPYCLVRANGVRYENIDVHGDTSRHFDGIEYPYEVFLLTAEDTPGDARTNAKELLRRVREWLRSESHFYLDGLTDDDGEHVVQLEIGEPRVGVQGLGGQNRGQYLGWAVMPLTVISEV